MDGSVVSVSKKILIGDDGVPSGRDNGSNNEGKVGSDERHGTGATVTLIFGASFETVIRIYLQENSVQSNEWESTSIP